MPNQLALKFPGTATKTGLTINAGTPYRKLLELGETMSKMHSQSRWWLGDLAIFVKTRHADEYPKWLERNPYDRESLKRYIKVCEQFSKKSRRKPDGPGMSFSHHQVVANMPPEEADAWLKESIKENYTVKELKRAIARSQQVPDDGSTQQSLLGTLEVAIVPTAEQKTEALKGLRLVADLGNDDGAGGDVLLLTQKRNGLLDKPPREIAQFLVEVVHEKLGVEIEPADSEESEVPVAS